MREVVNAIFYVLMAGCAWSLLPHDFPTARFCKLRKPQHISHSKWKTVYHYFRQWRIDGDWERIHEQLRQWVRAIEDRHPSPSAAQSHSGSDRRLRRLGRGCVRLDSQSVQRVRATEVELPLPKGVRANARCRLRRLVRH